MKLQLYSISLCLCTLFQKTVVGCASVSLRRHFLSQNIQRWPSDDACSIICFNDTVVPIFKCQWKKSAQEVSAALFFFFPCITTIVCSTTLKEWLVQCFLFLAREQISQGAVYLRHLCLYHFDRGNKYFCCATRKIWKLTMTYSVITKETNWKLA